MDEQKLCAAVDEEELLSLAKELIAVEGHLEHPRFESDTAQMVQTILQREGIECELIEVAPNRFNVYAKIKGSGKGDKLVLNAHLDTVPAYGMANAFTPMCKGGMLYGRGSSDTKGNVACLCYVMILMKRLDIKLRGDLILLCTCDEESGSIGARAALKDLVADYAIVCESTNLNIGIGHKGVEWFSASFTGFSTHSGRPDNGINAIYAANDFINMLRRYDEKVVKRNHPLIGRSSLNVGTVVGGSKVTVVPDQCTVGFDRRWIPGETRQSIMQELNVIVEEFTEDSKHKPITLTSMLGNEEMIFPEMETPKDCRLIVEMESVQENILGRTPQKTGMAGWTEAALFQSIAQIPTIIFGPGDISQAHSNEEYVAVQELVEAMKCLLCIAQRICS